MSEDPTDFAPDDTTDVGTTSGEAAVAAKPRKRGFFQRLHLFNTMLLISFLLITLAFMLMLWHLVDRFGAIWDAPWNV